MHINRLNIDISPKIKNSKLNLLAFDHTKQMVNVKFRKITKIICGLTSAPKKPV
jgi:hypothetical protein